MKPTYIILTTLLLITLLLSGCSGDKEELTNSKSDKDLFELIKFSNSEEANKLLHFLDSLEKTGTYSEDIINAHRTKIYFDLHQYRLAEFYGLKAIDYLPRMEQTYIVVANTKDIPPSMKDYCLSKLELTKAEIYARANNHSEAKKYFEKYLATETAKSGEDWLSPQGYYEGMGMKEKVLEIYNKWDEICDAQHIPYNKDLTMLCLRITKE